MSTTASALGLGAAATYSVRDLWAHTNSTSSGTISASVPSHGAAMYVMSGGGTPPIGTTSALRGTGSGRCLDVTGASQINGAFVTIWDCHGRPNQSWTSNAAGELRVYGTKCLDVSGAATANGSRVVIWDCNGQANQRWRLNTDGSITAVGANRCLDVAATANGSTVRIWDCNGGTNQRWSRV